MEIEEFYSKMKSNFSKINIGLNEIQIMQFYQYMNLLISWNEKMNLTAITNPEDIILKHFLDSCTIAKYIMKNDKLIDIGTGAGFPGIPIKIIKPEMALTLLDSLNKRIVFLNEIIKQLKLDNTETIHERAEKLNKDNLYYEKYDICTSRAVAKIDVLAKYMLPFLKKGAKCICMKGQNIEEINNCEKELKAYKGKIIEIETFNLPGTDMKRNLIIIQKI